MNNPTSPDSIEEKLYAANRMPPRPEFLAGLRLRLAGEPAHPLTLSDRLKRVFRRTSTALAFSLLLILAAAFFVAGPQRVIAAMQQLIGYVPGIGFVENAESVRVLAGPVTLTKDGVTATVSEAVADAKSTRVNLRLDGSAEALQPFFKAASEFRMCQRRLILPDGAEFSVQSWSAAVGKTWLTFQFLFPPVPDKIMDVTLVFDPIAGESSRETVSGWQIPLHFQPGKASGQVLAAASLDLPSQEMNEITMTLESVVQTAGMDALKISLHTKDPALHVYPNWDYRLKLADQSGQNRLIEPTSLFDQDGFEGSVIKTPILEPGIPYTLTLEGPLTLIKTITQEDTGSQFTLDLGADPQPGQSWELDQTLQVGGQTFHLTGAHLSEGDSCSLSNSGNEVLFSLAIDFVLPPGVTGVMVGPVDERPKASRIYQDACVVYPETPSGKLEFGIQNVSFSVEGNWMITFQAPAQ